MIKYIVKENIKYLNMNTKELAKKSNLSIKNISEIIQGKKNPEISTLSKLEKGLQLPKFSLIDLNNEIKKYEIRNKDIGLKTIALFLEKQKEFKLYSKESLINIASKFIGYDCIKNKEKDFLKQSHGFKKFKNNPFTYLWLSILEKKYSHLKSSGKFKKANGSNIIKEVLNIMTLNKNFYDCIEHLRKYLDKNGIVLINAPYIMNSNIEGATYTNNNQKFIFMSDKKKREYQYIFSLIHKLFHYYEDDFEEKQNHKVANYIIKHLNKDKKKHQNLKLAMTIYDNKHKKNKWDWLYEKTKNGKINFGNVNSFWKSI